jgi:FKBP-type peptidyl-prolyl cis-trans isomerase
MKNCFALAAIATLSAALLYAAPEAPKVAKAQMDNPDEWSYMEKVSYAIGLDMGGNLKQMDIDANTEKLQQGIVDGLSGAEPVLSEDQIRETMMKFQQEMMAKQKDLIAKQQKERSAQGETNLKEGEEFLAENAKKEGVKVTASGLQYMVVKEGEGEKPKPDDIVEVNYRGTLIDGTEFDSSYARGEPVTFPLNQVIKGWTEGLQLMPVGSEYKFFVPPDLAYGARGAGADIGPNATLIFDVELLGVEHPETQPDTAEPEATESD